MKRVKQSSLAFPLIIFITICLFMYFSLLIFKYPLVGIEVEEKQGKWVIENIYEHSWADENHIKTGSTVTLVNGMDPGHHHTVTKFNMVEMADSITITDKNGEVKPYAVSYHDFDFQLIVYFVIPVVFSIFCIFFSFLLYKKKGKEHSTLLLILFLLSIGLCYLGASASARADLIGRITTTMTFSGSIVVFIHFLKAYFTVLKLEFITDRSIILMDISYFTVLFILFSSFFFEQLYSLTKDIELGFVCFLVVSLLTLFVRFYHRYKRSEISSLLKILWVTFTIAFFPFTVLYAIPYIFWGKWLISAEMTAGFLFVIPLAFVYLQLAERFFDMDFFLRKLSYHSLFVAPFSLLIATILSWWLNIILFSGTFFLLWFLLFTAFIFFLYMKEYVDYQMKHVFSQRNDFQTGFQLYHFFQKTIHEKKVSGFISSLINEIKKVLSVKEVYYVEIQTNEAEHVWKVCHKKDDFSHLACEIEAVNWQGLKPGSLVEVSSGFCVVIGEDYQRKHIIFCGLKKYKVNLNIQEKIWLETVAYFSSILLENFQLIEGLFQQIEKYKEKGLEEKENYPFWLSKLLFALSEKERMHLSFDLHDTVLQDQLQLLREIDAIKNKVTDPLLKDDLVIVYEKLLDNIHLIRETCNELRPPFLKELGIIQALQNLIDKVKLRADFLLHAEFDSSIPALDQEYELAIYRVIQELLNNALKHSKATEVHISLIKKQPFLILTYSDNGIGIEMSKLNDSFQTMGIAGMKERITCLGGKIKIHSRPNNGLHIYIELGMKEG